MRWLRRSVGASPPSRRFRLAPRHTWSWFLPVVLLPGHGDAESFLGGDEVVDVFGGLFDVDLDPADSAGEGLRILSRTVRAPDALRASWESTDPGRAPGRSRRADARRPCVAAAGPSGPRPTRWPPAGRAQPASR